MIKGIEDIEEKLYDYLCGTEKLNTRIKNEYKDQSMTTNKNHISEDDVKIINTIDCYVKKTYRLKSKTLEERFGIRTESKNNNEIILEVIDTNLRIKISIISKKTYINDNLYPELLFQKNNSLVQEELVQLIYNVLTQQK